MSKLRDRLTNPKDIERYDRNYNSMEVCMTQGELDREYIHIPQNATNGDVIRALFPDGSQVKGAGIYVMNDNKSNISYDFDWWNASYKVGDTDGK